MQNDVNVYIWLVLKILQPFVLLSQLWLYFSKPRKTLCKHNFTSYILLMVKKLFWYLLHWGWKIYFFPIFNIIEEKNECIKITWPVYAAKKFRCKCLKCVLQVFFKNLLKITLKNKLKNKINKEKFSEIIKKDKDKNTIIYIIYTIFRHYIGFK